VKSDAFRLLKSILRASLTKKAISGKQFTSMTKLLMATWDKLVSTWYLRLLYLAIMSHSPNKRSAAISRIL